MRLLLFLLFLSPCFLSCSSSGRLPEHIGAEFTTRITSSGLKHFQMRLMRKPGAPVENKVRRPADSGMQARKPEQAARKAEKLLLSQAEQAVDVSNFCREGYWLIDENYYGNTPFVRGECNETATEEDRKNFPDTITKW